MSFWVTTNFLNSAFQALLCKNLTLCSRNKTKLMTQCFCNCVGLVWSFFLIAVLFADIIDDYDLLNDNLQYKDELEILTDNLQYVSSTYPTYPYPPDCFGLRHSLATYIFDYTSQFDMLLRLLAIEQPGLSFTWAHTRAKYSELQREIFAVVAEDDLVDRFRLFLEEREEGSFLLNENLYELLTECFEEGMSDVSHTTAICFPFEFAVFFSSTFRF